MQKKMVTIKRSVWVFGFFRILFIFTDAGGRTRRKISLEKNVGDIIEQQTLRRPGMAAAQQGFLLKGGCYN